MIDSMIVFIVNIVDFPCVTLFFVSTLGSPQMGRGKFPLLLLLKINLVRVKG